MPARLTALVAATQPSPFGAPGGRERRRVAPQRWRPCGPLAGCAGGAAEPSPGEGNG